MPKFSIYSGADVPGDPNTQRLRCEVGWAKGYDVQIAVTRLADGLDPVGGETSFDDSPTGTTITVTAGVAAAGTVTHAGAGPAPSEPAWQGHRMFLSRPQINQLIRTLREARDAAYGRDE